MLWRGGAQHHIMCQRVLGGAIPLGRNKGKGVRTMCIGDLYG